MSPQFYSNSPSSVDSWFECFPCGFALDCRLNCSVTVLDASYALLIKLEYPDSSLTEFLLKGCCGMSHRVCGVLLVHLALFLTGRWTFPSVELAKLNPCP